MTGEELNAGIEMDHRNCHRIYWPLAPSAAPNDRAIGAICFRHDGFRD